MHPQAVIRRVLPVLLLGLGAMAATAGVVKWTDAKGQVHYGDRPPDAAATNTVDVKIQQAGRPVTPTYQSVPADENEVNFPGTKPRAAAADEQAQGDEAKRREREAQELGAKRQREAEARTNKAIVDHCKAMRETYCSQGADVIRQKEYEHDQKQEMRQQEAALRSGRPIPPAQRITPRSPCEWPRTCKPK